MKSFSDRYSDSHHSTHETFADLVFCVLIVLVLFVMMLALEVSQRVRAELASKVDIQIEKVEDIKLLSPDEVAELSERLQKQQSELKTQQQQMLQQQERIQELQRHAASQASTVQNKIAALNGERRFTGATEQAGLLVAYEYYKDRFIFIRQKEFSHATTRNTGESDYAYALRQTTELVALALLSRQQRYFTADEASRLYTAFTEYKQINPTEQSYTISTERIAVTYSTGLSGYIAGDKDVSASAVREVESAVAANFESTGGESEAMYPAAKALVLVNQKRVIINEVSLSPKDFKDLLLAFGGRGVMLDFEGYDGPAPDWLVEEVLTPTGYIGKTPKLPDAN